MARISKIAAFIDVSQLYIQISNFFFPHRGGVPVKRLEIKVVLAAMYNACPTPWAKQIMVTTTKTAPARALKWKDSKLRIPNQTACGHRLLQKRHQERRQRNELGHQMGDVAVWCVRVTTSWRHSCMSFPFISADASLEKHSKVSRSQAAIRSGSRRCADCAEPRNQQNHHFFQLFGPLIATSLLECF